MLSVVLGVFTRIISNSYLNVFQKKLTQKGEHSSVINFYTYLGLTLIGVIICTFPIVTPEILKIAAIMGVLGALGNYYIIKALSYGELSSLAPINAYKPIVALVFGIFLLNEIPDLKALLGILIIIAGTFLLTNFKFSFDKAYFYRFLALIFSGSEAIFIKKLILLTDITTAFLFWAFAGLIFAAILAFKHKYKFQKTNIKYQLLLIISVGIMQYSTNFVFSKINVSYALALFQLSAILSVFLGVNIFKEKGLFRKLAASVVMIIGACAIIL